jgi:hypothetical protein
MSNAICGAYRPAYRSAHAGYFATYLTAIGETVEPEPP